MKVEYETTIINKIEYEIEKASVLHMNIKRILLNNDEWEEFRREKEIEKHEGFEVITYNGIKIEKDLTDRSFFLTSDN